MSDTQTTGPTAPIAIGNFWLSPAEHLVKVSGRKVPLPPTQFRLLSFLAQNRNRLVTYDAMLDHLYSHRLKDEPEPQAVKVLVCKIRRRLRMAGGLDGCRLQTIPGDGYRLQDAAGALNAGATDTLHVGDLLIQPSQRIVAVNGVEVTLTRSEFDVLHLLARRPNRVVSYQAITSSLYGHRPDVDWPNGNMVSVLFCRIRKKLAAIGMRRCALRTIWGQGCRLEVVS